MWPTTTVDLAKQPERSAGTILDPTQTGAGGKRTLLEGLENIFGFPSGFPFQGHLSSHSRLCFLRFFSKSRKAQTPQICNENSPFNILYFHPGKYCHYWRWLWKCPVPNKEESSTSPQFASHRMIVSFPLIYDDDDDKWWWRRWWWWQWRWWWWQWNDNAGRPCAPNCK